MLIPRLHAEDVEAIALRIAELMTPTPNHATWLTSAQVAERYGVSRDWVYDHADALGATPLGNGPRAQFRFAVARCDEYMEQRALSPASVKRSTKRSKSASGRTRNGAPLLTARPHAIPA